ncbi:unnamed protein product [Lupinus luteus]|uniref:Uncharacterized protein n=1 Tax=Lupinus luteus TaxID=3873 RepID=A0AAV1WX43_LUPLU
MWLVKVVACSTCRTPIRFNAEVNVAMQDDRKFFLLIVNHGGRRWLARVKGTVAMHGSRFCFQWWTMALINSGRGQGVMEDSERVFVMIHGWYVARSELFRVAPQCWRDSEKIQEIASEDLLWL